MPLHLQGEDRRSRKADLALCYAGGESWQRQINFCSGTLASILGPSFLSETGISLLDSKRLISIKDQGSVAGLFVLLVMLLSPDNQMDSKRLVKFIQSFFKSLLPFWVQVFLIKFE